MRMTLKALKAMSPEDALKALFPEKLKDANLFVLTVDAVLPTEKQKDQPILGNLSMSFQHVVRDELKVIIRDMKVRKDGYVTVPGKEVNKAWHSHVLLKTAMRDALARKAKIQIEAKKQ